MINSSDIIVANNDTKNVTSNSKNVTSNTENVTSNSKNVTTNLENVTYEPKNVTYKEENVPTNVPTGNGKNVATTKLNETELAVLKLLKKKPRITRNEIAESLSKNIRTIQRTLTSLKNKGYIQRVGPNKNVVWEVVKNVRNNK